MKNNKKNCKTIVVKVGTNVLIDSEGKIVPQVLASLTAQLVVLHAAGYRVLFVTSGAGGTGKSMLATLDVQNEVARKQVWAAVGQAALISMYQKLFSKHSVHVAQLLLTKSDFKSAVHRANLSQCIDALLSENIIPIINENDVVATRELMFTDNDELAFLVARMVHADAIFILSSAAGLFDGDPLLKTSQLIRAVEPGDRSVLRYAVASKSALGRGGMRTKCLFALRAARAGIDVHIASGTTKNVITELAAGVRHGTHFKAEK